MKRIVMAATLGTSTLLGLAACGILTDLDGFSSGGSPDPDGGSRSLDGAVALDGSTADGSSSSSSSGDVEGGSSSSSSSSSSGDSGPGREPLLVVAGGFAKQFEGPAFDTTYYAPLHVDGTLGDWKSGPKLPLAQSTEMRVAAAGGSVFVLFSDQVTSVKRLEDGLGNLAPEPAPPYRDSTCLLGGTGSNVFRLAGAKDGVHQDTVDSIDTFTKKWVATTKLPGPRSLMGCASTDAFVYVVAGKDSAAAHKDTVFVAGHIGSAIGPWRETKPLPVTAYWPRPVAVGSWLFVVGGEFDGKPTSTVYLAPINSATGELGEWILSPTPLPVNVGTASVAAWGTTIAVTGGGGGSDGVGTTKTFTSTVSPSNGALTPWVETTPLPVAVTQHGSAFLPP